MGQLGHSMNFKTFLYKSLPAGGSLSLIISKSGFIGIRGIMFFFLTQNVKIYLGMAEILGGDELPHPETHSKTQKKRD